MCIDKKRDAKGRIVGYVMCDPYGDKGCFDRAGVIQLMKDPKYEVINLQVDKLGRVVNKVIPYERELINNLSNKSENNSLEEVFNRAYGFIQKMGMVTICVKGNKKKFSEPFDKLDTNINIEKLTSDFEEFLIKKYNFRPTKLMITNQARGYQYIMYGKEYVDSSLLHPEDIFCGVYSVKEYEIKQNKGPLYKMEIKTGSIKDKKTGYVVNDAFCGAFVFDTKNKQACDWALHKMNELDKEVKKMNRSAGSKGMFDLFKR